MLERAPEFAVMLCFDVEIDKEAEKIANEQGVILFRGI
jgi:translation initiation factor 5B